MNRVCLSQVFNLRSINSSLVSDDLTYKGSLLSKARLTETVTNLCVEHSVNPKIDSATHRYDNYNSYSTLYLRSVHKIPSIKLYAYIIYLP